MEDQTFPPFLDRVRLAFITVMRHKKQKINFVNTHVDKPDARQGPLQQMGSGMNDKHQQKSTFITRFFFSLFFFQTSISK